MANGGVQIVPPTLTPVVKKLLIVNVAVWFFAVLILQGFFLQEPSVFKIFGLVPGLTIHSFFIWQPLTYMFVHSGNVFHILFNMLVVWMFGGELEARWGQRFFFTYYLVCGIGAAFIYLAVIAIHYLWKSDLTLMVAPVVGASGAVFGLILAYGLMFGERVVHFMMIFPMKAKYFALIVGLFEFFTMLDAGLGNSVANLAHVGGLVSGFCFLKLRERWIGGGRKGGAGQRNRRSLRLVVSNKGSTSSESDKVPRYWN